MFHVGIGGIARPNEGTNGRFKEQTADPRNGCATVVVSVSVYSVFSVAHSFLASH